MATLRLDENCMILPGSDVLHVLTRRGAFDLRGRDIHRLHQRMEPFLAGTNGEADLLAAVPAAHNEALRGYLAGLRELGALDGAGSPSPSSPEASDALARLPAPGDRRASLRVAGRRVHVSLDGWDEESARGHSTSIAFVSPMEAGALLVRAGRRGRPGRRILVVARPSAEPVPESEIRRRAALARWLLRNELGTGAGGGRVRVFSLDGPAGTLERLVEAEGDAAWSTWEIPSALRVVRCADAEQLPLVVAEASHPFFAPRLRGVGLSFISARDPLLRAFVARLPRSGEGEPVLVAPSRSALWARAVERAAETRSGLEPLAWSDTELLADADTHGHTRHLAGVLALRAPAWAGRVARTAEGVWIYERGGRRAFSLVREMALADLLLNEAWSAFHAPRLGGAGMPPPAWEHQDFVPAAALRRRVRTALRVLAGRGGCLRMEVDRVRCWGITAWVGRPRDGAGAGGQP